MTRATDDELIERTATLLRSDPPPIDAAAVRAAVRRAIASAEAPALHADSPAADDVDDALLVEAFADALAAHDPPPGAPDAELARRASDAAHVAPFRHAPKRVPQWAWSVAAAAVLALGVGLWVQLFFEQPSSPDSLVTHRLADGHRITATAETQLSFEEEDERVRVQLQNGEALFDVVPGSSFAVSAGDLLVRVTGTVFTVTRREAQVSVRVYEGSVRIEVGAGQHALRAGEVYVHRGGSELSQLDVAAERAVERRATERPEPAEARERAEPAHMDETETAGASRRARPRAPSILDARRALAEERYADALTLADRAVRRRPSHEWHMVRGDSLRGLARNEDALDAYRRAMRGATSSERAIAGLEGARLLASSLSRNREARRLLDESGALSPTSPVRIPAAALDSRLGPR